jgi:hypothetical protein
MNLTALALVGLAAGIGQPPADYIPIKGRSLKLPIEYTPAQRKNIQQIQLCVCRDQSGVYEVAKTVTPDQSFFAFEAKEDGLYWVNMVIVFRDGRREPKDPARVPPAQKLLIDATPPVVRILSAKREGEEVAVEWAIEDKFPNDAATQVLYKAPGGDWQPVPSSAITKRSARFKPSTTGPIAVQVAAKDLVGNTGSIAQEVPTGTTAAYMAPTTAPAATKPAGVLEAPTTGGPLPPPMLDNTNPAAPAAPIKPPSPVIPAEPPAAAAQPQWTPPAVVAQPAPLTTTDGGLQPIAVGSGSATAPPASVPANVQFLNSTVFDLQYQVENGPSGVSRIDLYVTRDDGRTWARWSTHDGRQTPLRVALETRFNSQVEGDYGLRLVPVSGAGLSAGAPTAGTPPEMRVHIDRTPPVIQVYQPTADPNQRNALVLHWKATDRNFGKDPIRVEWSEQPTGPWKSVGAGDEFTPVVGTGAPTGRRLANTGSYSWQIPATIGASRVHLKFTAWDAAGNKSEVVTPPLVVDLMRPRATIQGIATSVVPRP